MVRARSDEVRTGKLPLLVLMRLVATRFCWWFLLRDERSGSGVEGVVLKERRCFFLSPCVEGNLKWERRKGEISRGFLMELSLGFLSSPMAI